MRLVTYEHKGSERLGVVVGTTVVDLAAAANHLSNTVLPADMLGFLRTGDEGMATARSVVAAIHAGTQMPASYDLAEVTLRAPLPNPTKILCVGQNYRDHVLEQGAAMPTKPILFAKFATTVVGPGDDVIYPTTTQALDYEAELVVVIGKRGKHIAQADAYQYVAGYMVGQDVTARDLQSGDGQWVRGKSQDTTAPLGPYLVTRDDVPDPQNLAIKLWVNGQIRQNSTTANLIFSIPYLIEFISQGITLTPGDIIYTGTPPGVGAFSKPPALLHVGDTMDVEIEGLGRLTNTVIADPLAP